MDSFIEKQECSEKKDSSEDDRNSSKRKPKSFETDYGKEVVNIVFTEFCRKIKIRRYSRYSSKGAVFDVILNKTNRDPLETPLFGNPFANWIDEIQSVTKQYII